MFSFQTIIKYVWPSMRKFKKALYTIMFFFSVRILCDIVLTPFYFKKIIDLLSAGAQDHASVTHDIYHLAIILTALSVFVFVVARIIKFVYFTFEINVIHDLRNFAFQKLENHSHTFFANTFAGSLVTKSRRFVGAFETMFDIFIYNFLFFFVMIVGVFVVLVGQSLVMSLMFLAWIIIHIAVVSYFVKKKVRFDALEAEQDSKISGRLADVFGNILAVKFFSAREREIESFGEYTAEGARRSRKAWFLGGRIDMLQHFFIIVINAIVLFAMISLWLKGAMTTGTMVLIQTYMLLVSQKLWDLGNSLTKFMKSAADMQELVDIFEITPDILDPIHPEPLKITEGHIVFKDVFFKYGSGDNVLSNFNLDIKPGERVGVVGHSGAGKSTLTKLLLRFNDITGGTLSIDGQDVRNVAQSDLRSVVSYVPQEPILFHRTIRENIAYGKPRASDEDIAAVAQKAHANEFIAKLKYGYDTYVGERGVKLSGGERQRVAIARAMLKDSPILVLDEATSSLDSISESYIQEAFGELMKGKTTIVIAHRLSTIQKMDRIIVLDGGKIVEEGTHKQLLKKKGSYAELWDRQTGGFIE